MNLIEEIHKANAENARKLQEQFVASIGLGGLLKQLQSVKPEDVNRIALSASSILQTLAKANEAFIERFRPQLESFATMDDAAWETMRDNALYFTKPRRYPEYEPKAVPEFKPKPRIGFHP